MSIIQDPESGAWYDDEADLTPDPMTDPRVKALVQEAVNACEWARDNGAELVTLEAAIAAMKGGQA